MFYFVIDKILIRSLENGQNVEVKKWMVWHKFRFWQGKKGYEKNKVSTLHLHL